MTPGQDRVTSFYASTWAGLATPPLLGEVCFELDTGKYKYGNGATAFASLSYPASGGSSGPATWGSITGTLSSQADLNTALNARAFTSTLAAVATTGAYSSLTGLPTLGSAASTEASTWAVAASSYVYQAQIGTVASTAASTWALAASSYVYQAQLGTVASTAASTWALAASTYVYQAQLGTAASTAASNYASSTHRHDASHVTSGVFTTDRVASSGTASSNTVLYGNQVWGTLPAPGVGTVTSIGVSSAVAGMTVSGSPVTSAGTITLSGFPSHNLVSSAPASTIALGLNTYSTAASVSLTAGTWLINASMLIGRDTASTTLYTARLAAGSQNLSTAHDGVTANTSTYVTLNSNAVLINAGTTTVTWAGAASVVNSFIRQQAFFNAAGSTATFMNAVRIA